MTTNDKLLDRRFSDTAEKYPELVEYFELGSVAAWSWNDFGETCHAVVMTACSYTHFEA